MIKCLVIESPKLNPVSWWRAYKPIGAMRKQYGSEIDFTVKENVNEADILLHDVVIVFRPTEKKYLDFVTAAKILGKPVIIDVDDDLINLEPSHPLFAHYRERRQTILEIYAAADWIWCSTEQLMYAFDCFGRGCVVPNAIDVSLLPSEPAPMRRLAAWRGNVNQIDDLLANFEWYEQVKELPDAWAWMGYYPPLVHSDNVKHNLDQYVPIIPYMERIRNAGVNNLWKPLRPGKFNDAKSNISWIEATLGGGICVTNYAGKPGWESAVPDFNFDEQYVADWWAASCERIRKQYDIVNVTKDRFESIKNLLT